ncbi:xaa-Pro aminopeptidase-like protein [Lineolata rhizophorae]|uniref:Xaa-Pro aminopeptidase n=1 Tax=Lineolata rhizophorae TaxID=578093 RepID=A0A6A6NQR4_9PEZI|nr:xaa-Pro aminopeptidase-like protein [Lineolata rhizophorae]
MRSPALRSPWRALWQRRRPHFRLALGPPSRRRQSTVHVPAAQLQFGQPIHETHPHLLGPGELTPGITAIEYARRRANLASKLPEGAIAILAAAETKYRSGAVFYPYHQDPDFFYLTGFKEPQALAVIEKTGPGGQHDFHLYVRPKDAKAELWDGARSGIQAAEDVFNADHAGDVAHANTTLADILSSGREVYTDLPGSFRPSAYAKYFGALSDLGSNGLAKLFERTRASSKPLRPILNELRSIKSEAEIQNMRLAGQRSGRAITDAMRKQFRSERELDAFLDYRFKMEGCDNIAYVPVIAGGQHSLTIHYVQNDDVLNVGDLVLVDAGGEYGGYITDITRTWPVSGKFTTEQRELYEVVLRVQRTCVALCRENAFLSLDKLHKIAEEGFRDGLTQLGFDVSRNEALTTLFPHHVGHHVGLDVHDSPGMPRSAALRPGNCITIEPGIYVPFDSRWPARFQGIGIRIEDSVCVGPEHAYVLTTEAVKEVVDIEALRE